MKLTIPIRTTTESNAKENWRVKHARAKKQRANAAMWMLSYGSRIKQCLPVNVHLVRIGKRTMDDDNVQSSMKHVRDGIADWLGVDDGDRAKVTWTYDQAKGKEYGVEVEITQRSTV